MVAEEYKRLEKERFSGCCGNEAVWEVVTTRWKRLLPPPPLVLALAVVVAATEALAAAEGSVRRLLVACRRCTVPAAVLFDGSAKTAVLF